MDATGGGSWLFIHFREQRSEGEPVRAVPRLSTHRPSRSDCARHWPLLLFCRLWAIGTFNFGPLTACRSEELKAHIGKRVIPFSEDSALLVSSFTCLRHSSWNISTVVASGSLMRPR